MAAALFGDSFLPATCRRAPDSIGAISINYLWNIRRHGLGGEWRRRDVFLAQRSLKSTHAVLQVHHKKLLFNAVGAST